MNFVALGKVSWKNIKAIALQNGHHSQVTVKYRKKIKHEYQIKEIDELDEFQADFLFFVSMNSTEQIEIDSRIYHRITDPFYEVAKAIGTALKIEVVKTASPSIEKWHNYVYKSLLIFPPLIQKIGYTSLLEYDKRFFTFIQKYIPSLNLSSTAQLESIVNYEMHTRDYYIAMFKKLKPKVVCFYAFHYNAPLISAADELGILTVDLQHGLQVGWNPLYNNYDELPLEGYQALPDIFAVWGEKEYDNIRKTFQSQKYRPVYMGSPWLEHMRSFDCHLPDDIRDQLQTHKTKILIILQNQTTIPTLFKEIIEFSKNDILWVIRHHPKGERYRAKDFTETKDIVIDEAVDNILFSELFQHVDIAISEGSALSYEASYFGVKNIITSPMGLENYEYEIANGLFFYLEKACELDEILDKIKTMPSNSHHGYKTIEPRTFLTTLLENSEVKKCKHQKHTSKEYDQGTLEAQIDTLNHKMWEDAQSEKVDQAIKLFYELRLLLDKTADIESLYAEEQDRWMKEARVFKRYIKQASGHKFTDENIVMIGDSLSLPRPIEEAVTNNFGIYKTATGIFNAMLQDGLKMRTWGQRYLTTEKLLVNWEMMVENVSDKHLIVHLGLNDSAERIFLERQRLALDVYDAELKKSIIEFGKKYRKEIIENQYDHAYVGYENFKKNVHEIIKRTTSEKAKSITFINIIAFPKSHEIDTPGSIALTEKYNAFFNELKSIYPQVNIIDLNGIVTHVGFEKCMLPDNMHLSPMGHQVLANEIYKTLTKDEIQAVQKIAIIGVGQLGSRHLQGLKKITVDAHIELVEPNQKMQENAMQRYKELPENPKIASVRFCKSIEELSDVLDLVIVATNADVRASVIKKLIETKTVKHIILEKILFQKIEDYDFFEKQFEESNIKVWVNHPRREFDFYDKFLGDIRRSKAISYHVQGSRWGLASNGLHFLDHLLFLSGQTNPIVTIEKTMLCDSVEESKRAGFYEIFGSLVGKIGKATFCLNCDQDIEEGSSITITLLSDNVRLMIDDYKGKVMYAYRETDWKWEIVDEKIIYFQSELTGKIADSILLNSTCRLPTYEDACLLHKPFIELVHQLIESNLGQKFDICPIS